MSETFGLEEPTIPELRVPTGVDAIRQRPAMHAGDLEAIRARMEELAFLNPGLVVHVQGERLAATSGTRAWVASLAGAPLEACFAVQGEYAGVHVDLAIGWSANAAPRVRSFVNTNPSMEHGTHVAGMWTGLLAAVDAHAHVDARRALSPGLVAVVHIAMPSADFASPRPARLGTPMGGEAVARAIVEALPAAIERDPQLRAFLIGRLT